MTTFVNIREPIGATFTGSASDIFGYVFWTVYGPPTNLEVSIPNPSFPQGGLVQVQANFFDQSLNPIDPSLVALQIQTPDLIEVNYQYGLTSTITRDQAGQYHAFIDTTAQAGTYTWRWQSRGLVTVSMPDTTFMVVSSLLS